MMALRSMKLVGKSESRNRRAAQEEAKYDALSEKQLDQRIRKIEKEMLEAARNLEFERAASLRDELKALRDRLLAVGGEG